MITNLLLKDFKVYGQFIIIGLYAQLLFSTIMVTQTNDDSWRPYIFIGCVQISAVILFYLIFERLNKYDTISNSMPVSRKQIITSKFAGSVIIAAAGLASWYGWANFLNSVSDNVPADFNGMNNFTVVIIIIFYFALFVSFFNALSAKINSILILGVILTFIAFVFVKAMEISMLRNNDIGSLFDVSTILLLLIFSAVPLIISFFITVKTFKTRDIN